MRGEKPIQLEFNENLYRDGDGRLCIDDVTDMPLPTPLELKACAQTVGDMLRGWDKAQEFELIFGDDALKFVGIVDIGEWVSIDFEERVFRRGDSRFVIEETRNGQVVRDVFLLPAERELEAFKEEHDQPPTGRN